MASEDCVKMVEHETLDCDIAADGSIALLGCEQISCSFETKGNVMGHGLPLPAPHVALLAWSDAGGSGIVCQDGRIGRNESTCSGVVSWSAFAWPGTCSNIRVSAAFDNGEMDLGFFITGGLQHVGVTKQYVLCRSQNGTSTFEARVPPPPPAPPRVLVSVDIPPHHAVAFRMNLSGESDARYSLNFQSCAERDAWIASFLIRDGKASRVTVATGGTWTPNMIALGAGGMTFREGDVVDPAPLVHSPVVDVGHVCAIGTQSGGVVPQQANATTRTAVFATKEFPATLTASLDWSTGLLGYDIAIVPSVIKNPTDFDEGVAVSAYDSLIFGASVGVGLHEDISTAHDFVGQWVGNMSFVGWYHDASCTKNGADCGGVDSQPVELSSTHPTEWDFRVNYKANAIIDRDFPILVGVELPDNSYLSQS